MKTFTDEELVSSYLETRQNDYFEQLYERYCQKVHRKCLSFTKNSTQADDLTQDIFLRLMLKLDGYKQQAKFSTWLYSITFNYCADQVRMPRRYQEVSVDDNWDRIQIPVDDSAERDETAIRLVHQSMACLNADEQALLRRKYEDGISIKELANEHALTESAIKMRLKRSRDRLRQRYWQLNVE